MGSRPDLAASLSSNLLRLPVPRSIASFGVFARTFQTYQKSALRSNPARTTPVQKPRTAQNIKQQPAQTAPEPLRLTEVSPITQEVLLGIAIACSLRESLQGYQGLLPHLTQRTSITTCFPLPSMGQAHRPPGGSITNLQLFKSSTHHSRMQAAHNYYRCRLVATHQE